METVEPFKQWLRENGAELLPETNTYEVVRFQARNQTCVIYRGRRGISANGFARECWDAWVQGIKYMPMGSPQKLRTPLTKRKEVLRRRDGDLCFFCGRSMYGKDADDVTVEHLVGRGKGGPDHEDNLVLAHEECNRKADNLPLIQKIRLRETNLYGTSTHRHALPAVRP